MKKVYLVGGGPGSPDLVTQRGKTLIEQCDVLIYDNLVNREICQWANETCEQIYVGKQSGKPSSTQDEICKLILKKSQENKMVVRLKGGDPFVFGRASEELAALSAAGIQFEIVSISYSCLSSIRLFRHSCNQ